MKKSQAVQFLLTFLFGPLGILYSHTMAAVVTTCATLLVAMFGGAVAIIMWPMAIIIGIATVSSHNNQIETVETIDLSTLE